MMSVVAEDGPQLFLFRNLPDDGKQLCIEAAQRILLRLLDFGLGVLRKPLKIDLGALKLALQAELGRRRSARRLLA